jgi:hypothetical protein
VEEAVELGQGSGFVLVQQQNAFQRLDQAFPLAVVGEGVGGDEGEAPGDLGASGTGEQGAVLDVDARVFTTSQGPQGPAELHEEARSEDAKDTVGELVTCPFCMSVWVVSTLTAGQLLWPRATRTTMGALAALAGALVAKTTGE